MSKLNKRKTTVKKLGRKKWVIPLLLALVTLVGVFGFVSPKTTPVQAAELPFWTVASQFDYFSNGATYSFSNPGLSSALPTTVDTSKSRGSAQNPYVINTPQQWARLSDETTSLHGMVFVLARDLDMQGSSYRTKPVGASGESAFSGILYGQNHVIKNAVIANAPPSGGGALSYSLGLFGSTQSGSRIVDLGIAASCRFETHAGTIVLGSFAGNATGTTFINCHNEASLTFTRDVGKTGYVGGIAGSGDSSDFYKCGNRGKLSCEVYLESGTQTDLAVVGGICALFTDSGKSGMIENCYNYGNTSAFNGAMIGGIIGVVYGAFSLKSGIVDCVVKSDMQSSGGGAPSFSASVGGLEAPGKIGKINNLFFSGQENGRALLCPAPPSATTEINGLFCSRKGSTLGINSNDQKVIAATTLVDADDLLIEKAKTVLSEILWDFSGPGMPRLKDAQKFEYNINYNLNGGTQASGAPTTYTAGVEQILPTPTKTGEIFEGWYTDYSFSGEKVTKIAFDEVGNKMFYAKWKKLFDITECSVSADKTTVGYGGSITLTAAVTYTGLDSGVTVSYRWCKGEMTLEGEREKNLSLTKVANSGTYKCIATATGGGQTVTKESAAVTVTVTKATPKLTAPTASGTVYIGQLLNNTALSLVGGSALNPNNSAAVAGTFSWTTPTGKISSTNGSYGVTFTPTDTANYTTATVNVQVPATQLTVTFKETFKGATATTGVINVDYGATLGLAAFPAITAHVGYTGKRDVTADITNITGSKTVNVTYTANTNTGYQVWHFKQNADGTWLSTASETESLTGTTDATATAVQRSYSGFSVNTGISGTLLSGTIVGDGTLVLKVYYTRNSYDITYHLNGGLGTAKGSALFGAEISKPTAPTNAGYTFGGWFKDAAFAQAWKFAGTASADTMPLGGITLYAKWTLKDISAFTVNGTKVTVEYGGNITISVATITHEGTSNGVVITYQWYKDSVLIPGATASSYVLTKVADSGTYKCIATASGSGQSVTKESNAIAFTVTKAAPKLVAPTASGTVYIGQLLNNTALSLVGGSASNPTTLLSVVGTFAWTAPTTKISATGGSYSVTFTPADTENYETATASVQVNATQLSVTFVETFKTETPKTTVINVDYGATLGLTAFPAITVHAGYTGKRDITADITNITSSKTVNITYTANTDTGYRIWHFKQNADGTWPSAASEAENLTATTDEQITATAKTYPGFTFDRTHGESVLSGAVSGDGTLLLKLYYSRKTYTLFLNLRGGSGTDTLTALYGTALDKPADPVKLGYVFGGWYKESECVNLWRFQGDLNPDLLTEDGTSVYAKWMETQFRISYINNRLIDGTREIDESYFQITPAEGNPILYHTGTPSFVLRAPSAEGYIFAGWYKKDTNIKYNQISLGSMGDLELEAHWNPSEFVVRFDAQGGKASVSSLLVTNLGVYGKLPTATKSGATFLGWFEEPDGAGVQILEGDFVRLKSDRILYAAWENIRYRIQLNDGGKGCEMIVTKNGAPFDWQIMTVTAGDVLNVKVNAALGYDVLRITIDGKPASNGGNFLVKTNYADKTIVVTPQTRLITYTVTYYLNGGTQGKPSDTPWVTSFTVEDEEYTLPPPAEFDGDNAIIPNDATPKKSGYFFLGWFKDREFMEGINVIEQGTAENLTLYACWGALDQTVTFKGNYGGSISDELQLGKTDTKIVLKSCAFESNEDRVDFRFLGWASTPNGVVEYEDGAIYTVKPDNNVLYAVWHVANMQFVTINVKNDLMVFGSNSEGIVMTPHPGYPYKSDNVELTYQWFRLDSNGTYVKYGDAITFLASVPDNPDGTNAASIFIQSVKDSGSFKCILVAKGETAVDATDPSGNPINMVTTAEGEGLRSVSMEKAVFGQIGFVNNTVEYDGQKHSIFIGNQELPEGITVSYTGNGIVKAGKSEVVAVFSVLDNANYKPIDSMRATLEITPKKITSVTFVGSDKAQPDNFSYIYNGSAFTITASFGGVLAGDDVRATLSDASFTNAGTYTALITGIEGSECGNYILDTSLTNISRVFTIGKATYHMSAVKFIGKSVIYNGIDYNLFVTGAGLPSGVGVSYRMVYTPFSSLSIINGEGNGGVNAGTYVITAVFAGDDENYYSIPTMTATLTVGKADFDLNFGEFKNTTVSYAVGTRYNPTIDLVGQGLEQRIEIGYNYFVGKLGIFEPIQIGTGLSAAGIYKINAAIRFLLDEDLNNYNAIAEKSILFNISELGVDRLSVQNSSIRKYKVGETFDVNEIVVTAHYSDGTNEEIDHTKYMLSSSVFTSAGEFTITVSYLGKSAELVFDVGKGDYDISTVTVSESHQYLYDKTAKLPEIVGDIPEGVTVVFRYSIGKGEYFDLPENGLTQAGVYEIEISFAHSNPNYNAIATTLTCKMVISPKEVGIEYGAADFVYDGTEHSFSAKATGVLDGDTVTFQFAGGTGINAGEYLLTVSLPDDVKNYILPAVGTSKVWTITAQEVSVSLEDPTVPLVYNGEEQSVNAVIRGSDGEVLDALKAVIDFGRDIKFMDAGNYTATVVGIKNADDTLCINYKLPNSVVEKDYVIAPKTVQVVWEVSKEQNGETVWQLYDEGLAQLIYNGALQATRIRAGFYDGTDGGGNPVYHVLNLDFGSLSLVNAGSYDISASTAEKNFTLGGDLKTVLIHAQDAKVFFEVNVKGVVEDWRELANEVLTYRKERYALRAYYFNTYGNKVELNVFTLRGMQKADLLAVGNYSAYVESVNEDSNYNLTGMTADGITINPCELVIDWTEDSDMVYNGKDKTVTAVFANKFDGDDVVLLLKGNIGRNADTYTASAEISGEGVSNYVLSVNTATHVYTVSQREITVTIGDTESPYNGQEPTAQQLAEILFSVTTGIVANGDELGIIFEKELGVAVKTGGYAITGRSENTNYAITFVGNYAADKEKGLYNIVKAEPVVTPTYDATLYEGRKLSANMLKLSGGNTPGTIVFDNINDSIGKAPGIHSFVWTFTPGDTVNFKSKTGVIEIEIVAVLLDKIEVTTQPTVNSYLEGEKFDPSGIVVTATFNNGSTELVQEEVSYFIGDENALDVILAIVHGKITVSYMRDGVTKTCELTISVTDKVVQKIEVESPPDRLDYIEGQKFESKGLAIKVTYQNDVTETVTENWIIDLQDVPLKVTDKKVTVTFGGKTVDIDISVAKKKVESIEVTHAPNQTHYIEGTNFDPTGLVVTARFNDGTSKTAEGLTFNKTVLELGDIAVQIGWTFDGVTVSIDQEVTVEAKSITSIAVTSLPKKTVYAAFEKFDPTGMVITATYNNGTEGIITEYIVDSDKILTVDDVQIEVFAGEAKAIVNITVNKIDYDLGGWTFEDKTVTYNGAAHTMAVQGNLPAGVTVKYLIGGDPTEYDVVSITDVGVTVVTARFTVTDKNYNAIPEQTATLTVSDLKVFDTSEIGSNLAENLLYNGEARDFLLTGKIYDGSGNETTFEKEGISYKVNIFFENNLTQGIRNSGSYRIEVIFSHNNAEYAKIKDSSFTVNVDKAVLNLTPDAKETVYGEDAPELTYTLTGFVGSDTAGNVIGTGNITLQANYGRGDGVNDYVIEALGSLEYDNYSVVYNKGVLSVTKRVLTVEFSRTDGLLYSGTEQTITVSFGNRFGSDVVEASVSYNDTVLNVGKYTATVSFGKAESNYALPESGLQVTFDIAKAKLTDTSTGYMGVFDGIGHGVTVSAIGFVDGESLILGTVTYGTDENYGSETNLLITNVADSKTVYYRVEFGNYETITGSKEVTLTAAESIVHPIYDGGELYEGDALPELKLSADDTLGSLTLDAGQKLAVGELEYTWTFVPESENYKDATGRIQLKVAEGGQLLTPDEDSSIGFAVNNNGKLEVQEHTEYNPDVTAYLVNLPEKTSLAELLAQLNNNGAFVKIFDATGTPIDATDYSSRFLGTGVVLELRNAKGAVMDKVTAIVRGELSGDGKINMLDKSLLQSRIAQIGDLSVAAAFAADINGDGKINMLDKAIIQSHIAQLSNIFESAPAPIQKESEKETETVMSAASDTEVSEEETEIILSATAAQSAEEEKVAEAQNIEKAEASEKNKDTSEMQTGTETGRGQEYCVPENISYEKNSVFIKRSIRKGVIL